MTAHLLTIGDEILIGQITDTNTVWMSRELNLRGIRVTGKSSVGDVAEDIVQAVHRAAENADIILMTGGLGPTKDDITKTTLAALFGSDFYFHEETYEWMRAYFQKINRDFPEDAARNQAMQPEGATILNNKVGSAPGMWFERGGKVYVAMPGVPFEMEYLMTAEVLPRLLEKFDARPIAHRTILTVGEGESVIANRIEAFENGLPRNLKLAYLPALGQVRLRLTGIWQGNFSPDAQAELDQLLDKKRDELAALLPDLVFGFENTSLEKVVGEILREQQKTLATAESCTGGYIAHLLTLVPGSSDYFLGSVVSYSNSAKQQLLDVQALTLEQHGAVSEQTVREMAGGARRALGADVAISISGIAGPSGGTAEKPVGTVWMCVSDGQRTVAQRHIFGRDRGKNIHLSAVYALNLLRKFLLNQV